MWFKNLILFRFIEPFDADAAKLSELLAQDVFHPCGSQETIRHGWVPPLGRKTVDFVHAIDGRLLICLQTQERLLPAGVVKEAVAERVERIEEQQVRTVRRREKDQIRDEVVQELLPRAFTRTRQTLAYIDLRSGWLVIDGGGRKAAEELTGRLRTALGSLPIAPPRVSDAPAVVMTHWLANGGLPGDFAVVDECELRGGAEDGSVVRCKGQDLTGEEIQTHLQAGKQVTRLALIWNGRLAFTLNEDLSVRRLRFLDVVQEQLADINAETAEQILDAEFALMIGELGVLLPRLMQVFGGEGR